jgi:RHS repeat-associated protein
VRAARARLTRSGGAREKHQDPEWASQRALAAFPGTVVYYHSDVLGSSLVTTDQTGSVVDRASYKPYGDAAPAAGGGSSPVPEFGFTGQRHIPSVGIYDYGARFYDPALGRFLQPDSQVPEAFDPQSLNRYSYVRNSPTNRIDPTGNFDFWGLWGGFTDLFGDLGGFFYNDFLTPTLGYFWDPTEGFSLDNLSDPIREYLPGLLGAPLAGTIDALEGVGQTLTGVATFNGDRIAQGLRNAGLGVLSTLGLREAVTEPWGPGRTGGFLPRSLNDVVSSVRSATPPNAFLNGMHAWHAGTNAAIANRVGPLVAPFQLIGGIYHETPLDWNSFSAEQRFQGSVNHFLDSITDIGANIVGQALGYLLPSEAAQRAALGIGNQIPGPGDPDPEFGGCCGTYTGDPADAWGQYP